MPVSVTLQQAWDRRNGIKADTGFFATVFAAKWWLTAGSAALLGLVLWLYLGGRWGTGGGGWVPGEGG